MTDAEPTKAQVLEFFKKTRGRLENKVTERGEERGGREERGVREGAE